MNNEKPGSFGELAHREPQRKERRRMKTALYLRALERKRAWNKIRNGSLN